MPTWGDKARICDKCGSDVWEEFEDEGYDYILTSAKCKNCGKSFVTGEHGDFEDLVIKELEGEDADK